MKKILVILVVIGLLISGAVAITAEEENNFQGVDIVEDLDDGPGDPAPCGGGAGGGGGSPG
ncbi:MAG: hypothetical protein PVF58_22225 [Candidatus Methanofastidiosia archaeon]|jgi:hypothetical protein